MGRIDLTDGGTIDVVHSISIGANYSAPSLPLHIVLSHECVSVFLCFQAVLIPMCVWIVHDVILGIREEMQTPDLAAIDELEFPELHEESMGTVAFLRALSKLMRASGVMDFSLKDVFKPEASRVQRMLSAIINFAKFREEKVADYDELIDASDSLASRREELEATQSRLVRSSHVSLFFASLGNADD